MNRLPIAVLLAAVACSAHAQQPPEAPTSDTQLVQQMQVHTMNAEHGDHAGNVDFNCLQATGSRIVTAKSRRGNAAGDTKCVNASGRSYGRNDLERTGETDPARALEKLDPSITIHR